MVVLTTKLLGQQFFFVKQVPLVPRSKTPTGGVELPFFFKETSTCKTVPFFLKYYSSAFFVEGSREASPINRFHRGGGSQAAAAPPVAGVRAPAELRNS